MSSPEQGNSETYTLRRLKRDRPDLAEPRSNRGGAATHICRGFAGRHGIARGPTNPIYPYLLSFGVRRSTGVIARLEVDAVEYLKNRSIQ
jgi:hypothetical protein